jgi:hypothetical protein
MFSDVVEAGGCGTGREYKTGAGTAGGGGFNIGAE